MKLSIVTTLYCSSRYIEEFHKRITAEANKVTDSYEIIFVNDGSSDDSLSVVQKICEQDAHVKVIDLSRNYGHHRAMMCGIQHSKGERVFLIDVDLEEQPESLSQFWQVMNVENDIDVVVGELAEKTVPFLKRVTSDLFYKVFNSLSIVKISSRDIVSRLMTRDYVNALIEYSEKEIFFPAIWEDAGFRQLRVVATKSYDGSSTYTLRRKLAMAVDAITSFSSKPLIYIFYLGLMFSLGSLAFIAYLIIRKFLVGQVVLGWTSVMAAQFLIGGIIIFSLGIIGIYLSKIYIQVKSRPNCIVKKIYQHTNI
ncbi:MAG: glycosyltransferase family 2 protein [Methylobacter sp.]